MESELPISPVLPGVFNSSQHGSVYYRLTQPTTFIDPANGKRVTSRPSVDQIANLVIGSAPFAPEKRFKLEVSVRTIRLKEDRSLAVGQNR